MTQLVSSSISAAMASLAFTSGGRRASGRQPYGRASRRRRHIADEVHPRSPRDCAASGGAISIASPQAVEPSYIEAFATSMPVRPATWVWNSNRTCSVPWAISGW